MTTDILTSIEGRRLGLDASNNLVMLGADGKTYMALKAPSSDVNSPIVAAAAATLTVTALLHAGKTIVLDKADGQAITLPHATGTGDKYTFVVKTTITSVGTTIKVPAANPTDSFLGMAWVMSDNSQAVLAYLPAAGDDTMTMNGTTQGGYAGHKVTFEDVGAGLWEVQSFGKATGAEATPFSASVS